MTRSICQRLEPRLEQWFEKKLESPSLLSSQIKEILESASQEQSQIRMNIESPSQGTSQDLVFDRVFESSDSPCLGFDQAFESSHDVWLALINIMRENINFVKFDTVLVLNQI